MVVALSKLEGAIALEVERRRNFAIISHPDAGKTRAVVSVLTLKRAVEWPVQGG